MKKQTWIMRVILCLCCSCGSAGFSASAWPDAAVDHSIYAELLNRCVKNGSVDYQDLKNEEAKLDRYLKVLEGTDTKKLLQDER